MEGGGAVEAKPAYKISSMTSSYCCHRHHFQLKFKKDLWRFLLECLFECIFDLTRCLHHTSSEIKGDIRVRSKETSVAYTPDPRPPDHLKITTGRRRYLGIGANVASLSGKNSGLSTSWVAQAQFVLCCCSQYTVVLGALISFFQLELATIPSKMMKKKIL